MDNITVNDCEEGLKSKPKFMINKPHEGPDEYVFDFISVDFIDGVKRFICKSEIVPQDYWPRMVYNFNLATGGYEQVGMYKKNEENIYIFI
jgi:hypothetical protein